MKPQTDRTSRGLKLLALAGSFMVVRALAGCTPPPSQASLTTKIAAGVKAAHEGTNVAFDAFVKAQEVAEGLIVVAAPTEAEGLRALAELDKVKAPILEAFRLAYRALQEAEDLLVLVRNRQRAPASLLPLAMKVGRAVAAAVSGAR